MFLYRCIWVVGILVGFIVLAGAQTTNDIVTKMRTDLNLEEDQVANITPVIEKYRIALADLQKSIDEGTINPSVVDSQRQQIQAAEDQAVSQYLRPDQVLQWRYVQAQIEHNSHGDSQDTYSNYPKGS